MPIPSASDLTDWLRRRLTAVSDHIDSMYLFGSVTRGVPNPGDCDLLVLTPTHPDAPARRTLKARLATAEDEFLAAFGFPLSVILLGVEEYRSLRWFKRRGREKTLVEIALDRPA